jgi:hypothetical protein
MPRDVKALFNACSGSWPGAPVEPAVELLGAVVAAFETAAKSLTGCCTEVEVVGDELTGELPFAAGVLALVASVDAGVDAVVDVGIAAVVAAGVDAEEPSLDESAD